MTVYVNNKGTDFKEVVDDLFLLSDDLQSLVESGLHFYPSYSYDKNNLKSLLDLINKLSLKDQLKLEAILLDSERRNVYEEFNEFKDNSGLDEAEADLQFDFLEELHDGSFDTLNDCLNDTFNIDYIDNWKDLVKILDFLEQHVKGFYYDVVNGFDQGDTCLVWMNDMEQNPFDEFFEFESNNGSYTTSVCKNDWSFKDYLECVLFNGGAVDIYNCDNHGRIIENDNFDIAYELSANDSKCVDEYMQSQYGYQPANVEFTYSK